MEIKTSEEIEWWLFEQSKNNPKNSEHIKKQMESKKWVSVESLWFWIEKNKHLPRDSMMNKFVNELPI